MTKQHSIIVDTFQSACENDNIFMIGEKTYICIPERTTKKNSGKQPSNPFSKNEYVL